MKNFYFTSESVTEGHPDKACDRIIDTILDESLITYSDSKMAVKETIKDDLILIYGEKNSSVKIDYENNTLDVLKKIGSKGNYNVIINVSNQPNEINNAVVNDRKGIVAGNQEIILNKFSFNVANIINELDLKKPIYVKTSCYGHFGRNDFT